MVYVDGALGGEDDVGAAGDADGDGDPAGVAAHDLDDLAAGVGFGGGVQAIDGLGGDGDGGVKAEEQSPERRDNGALFEARAVAWVWGSVQISDDVHQW